MTTHTTFDVRRGEQRGRTDLGWLRSRHSFSFGDYRDPERLRFRSLRVLNDDVVEAGGGFGEHGHRDMEIMSLVLDGALRHRDSTGTSGVIVPGDVQVMTAGRGIRHSEMNASATDPVHFLQIWIEPAAPGIEPVYAQRSFPEHERRNRWQLIVSPDGRDRSLRINQDAAIMLSDLPAGDGLTVDMPAARYGYLHVVSGRVRVGDITLDTGDAIALDPGTGFQLEAGDESRLLLIDLA